MTYNKRQLAPIIDKYQINPNTNRLFITICEMFEDKSNYQLWGVKMVFSKVIDFNTLVRIKEWIDNNSALISKLEKKNIVSYNSKKDIIVLQREMEGLEMISFIKGIISRFNTTQRKLLMSELLDNDKITPSEAYYSDSIRRWYKNLKAFNKKPMNIKNKFYSSSSALKTIESLSQAILDCLEESYSWNEGKEDLFAFMEHNTPDCEVVFENGPCVIVYVPSFSSSHKLCGNGRTGWCISREESYFKSYVTSKSNRSQYFLFDFSRKECDAFAHIGFTIENGTGIVEAQTCNNYSMIRPYQQGRESLSITDVFKKYNITMDTFLRLKKPSFTWGLLYFLESIKTLNGLVIAYNNNSRVILEVNDLNLLSKIIGWTYLSKQKVESYHVNGSSRQVYLLLDFNLDYKNSKSIVALIFSKDDYGIMSLQNTIDVYGTDISKVNYLPKIGINVNDFINSGNIDPALLLHKYIDTDMEQEAIKLIESDKNVDVNFTFRQRLPIYSAINHGMFNLFDAIVSNPSFKSSTENSYGETILETLLYLYGSDEIAINSDDKESLSRMIASILKSPHFDFNALDMNNDSALMIACEFACEAWVVESLCKNRKVNVNIVNEYGCNALSNCIINGNKAALGYLLSRPDLIIREEDAKLARKHGIDLKSSKQTEAVIYAER